MKYARTVTLVITVLVMVMLIGAQCAPATPAPPAEEPQEEAQAEEAAPAEKAKVVHWSMFSEGEPLQQLLDQATKDFMAENPDIEVEVKWAGRQVLTQLQSAIAAGTQVDIVDHSDDRVLNAIVVNDLALPLDEYLEEPAYDSDVPWKDTFAPGALDLGKGSDGKTYLIPRDDYISAFFYNTNMLEEMGLTPDPQGMEWDEFVNLLETIRTENPDVSPLGADGNVSFYNNWWFSYLAVRLAGKDALREAAYDKTGEKWGDPEFLQAAQMIRDLQDAGYFQKGFEGSVWPAAQVQWVNDEIAMMFMGAWLPNEMSEQAPEDFEISLFAFPSVSGGQGNEYVEHWANAYGVLKSAPYPDAAVRYLKFIMSQEIGDRISAQGVPVALAEVAPPAALASQYDILASQTAMAARAGLNTEIPNYMDGVFNVCDDQFFQLQLSPEEFIDCLKTESAAFWERQE
jgi:ABC-type glycerol-3-phosphate transport system substrate-binding protein